MARREEVSVDALAAVADYVRNEPLYTARIAELKAREAAIREANGIYTALEQVKAFEAKVNAFCAEIEQKEKDLDAQHEKRTRELNEAHAKRAAALDAKVAAERKQFESNSQRLEQAMAKEKANKEMDASLSKWQAELEQREKRANDADQRLRSKAKRMQDVAAEVINV